MPTHPTAGPTGTDLDCSPREDRGYAGRSSRGQHNHLADLGRGHLGSTPDVEQAGGPLPVLISTLRPTFIATRCPRTVAGWTMSRVALPGALRAAGPWCGRCSSVQCGSPSGWASPSPLSSRAEAGRTQFSSQSSALDPSRTASACPMSDEGPPERQGAWAFDGQRSWGADGACLSASGGLDHRRRPGPVAHRPQRRRRLGLGQRRPTPRPPL